MPRQKPWERTEAKGHRREKLGAIEHISRDCGDKGPSGVIGTGACIPEAATTEHGYLAWRVLIEKAEGLHNRQKVRKTPLLTFHAGYNLG